MPNSRNRYRSVCMLVMVCVVNGVFFLNWLKMIVNICYQSRIQDFEKGRGGYI